MEKRLFLLDAYALIYRSYFALNNNRHFNPVNSKGVNTAAILGFANTLVDLLSNEKPSHIAVVFDAPSATVRHEEYAEYKAHREEMPEDIRTAIPKIMEIIRAFRIPVLMSEGYEADDVIGTLAKTAEKKGYTTYMMTPDKDFGQLVSDHIFIYKPGKAGAKAEILGVKEVCDKYGIKNPGQVIDILGMWGDSADNIPGIPGVGEKTAIKFIQQYGSMEGLYDHVSELSGKIKENVENNREKAFLSKKLATIITDAPVEFNEKELVMEEMDANKLHHIFSELEFRTLSKRVLKKEILSTTQPGDQHSLFGGEENAEETKTENTTGQSFNTVENTAHTYVCVRNPAQWKELTDALTRAKEICVDTETTGLDTITAELVGVSLSTEGGKAWYIPFPPSHEEATALLAPLKPFLEDGKRLIIAHNLKFDFKILKKYGVKVGPSVFDTMIAHYLLQPDGRHNMDLLSENYLNYRPVSIESLIGKKGKNQLNMRDVEVDKVTEYAAEDADVTIQLKKIFNQGLEKEGLQKLFNEIEMPLVEVLSDMEEEGIRLDSPILKEFSAELATDLDGLEKEIYRLAGTKFNIDSPRQLGQILFDVLKLTAKAQKTKTGQYSTSEDVLQKMKGEHAIIDKVLDYRSLRKLKSTYADTLPEEVSKVTGRVHTTYSQTIAATGRLASNNPNLQNIPIKTERGREIRRAFIARDKDHTILSADYSQIELRIIAALSGDKNMIEAFRKNEDIHTATAARIFNVDQKAVDKTMRMKAKSVNFGIIYGQSAFGLSQNINVSRTEAKQIIDAYFSQYPGVKQYMEDSIEKARKKGYVETIMGRRRYLRDINSSNAIVRGAAERNAINAPVQGSAADIIKIAMINIHREMNKRSMKSKMLLQVHDELVFDAFLKELKQLKEVVKGLMENAADIGVPLIVDMNNAGNWLDAH